MKKFIKSTVAVTSAVAMAFTMAAMPAVNALADDVAAPTEGEVVAPAEPELFEPEDMVAGEAHYTVAGGFGKVTWKPLAKDDEMSPVEGIDGVYSFTAELPAYTEETEWQNRFKICKIDNTILDEGWSGSLCVGTTTYADNQSQIRILNQEAGTFTIYFDTKTGAVVVKDAAGSMVDLSISWVGYDNETKFMTPEEIAKTTTADWPADKVKVETVPAVDKINTAFADKIVNFVPDEMANGEVHYTVAGGFGATTWTPLARNVEMKEVDGIKGVYSFTAELPAYTEETEWQNRFKICRIDNTILDNGWSGSLCVGTNVYADNQSQIRILNLVEGLYTIYFDSNTGAVVVKDQSGQTIDLAISWVGYDNETNFLTPEHIANTTTADWPADKVKVETVPAVDKINAAFADKILNFVPDEMANGEVHYTVAGGFGATTWTPLARNVEMKELPYAKGVYTFTAELPAYTEETEYQNRFKICKIDNTILDNGWSGSLCVGTTIYSDNQSQIRILNKEAGTFTIYFDSATGGIIVKDAEGNTVDLSISWVGYDNETNFMTPEEIAKTTTADWPADKVKVDKVPDVAAVNTAIWSKANPMYETDTFANGETYYTVVGGFVPAAWLPLGKLNTMKATGYSDVYSFTVDLPAYDGETNDNRFKICRIDSSILDAGWSGSLCVGTNVYADNQSQIKIINKKAGTFTIYLDVKTGAVVVKDAAGYAVDMLISWVGFDNEAKFMTPKELAKTTTADWPADKVKVDSVPDLAAVNAAFNQKLSQPPVTNSLKLTYSTKTLYTGKSGYKTKIKATVTGSSKKVTWKSSKPSVATVSKSGTTATVAAKKAGTTVISATANGITKKVTIKVKNPTITVKQGSKKVSTITLKRGKSTTLKVTTSPSKAGMKATYANSASKKLIKISTKSGKVTVKALKKKGTAKIKITSGGAKKTITVKVK